VILMDPAGGNSGEAEKTSWARHNGPSRVHDHPFTAEHGQSLPPPGDLSTAFDFSCQPAAPPFAPALQSRSRVAVGYG